MKFAQEACTKLRERPDAPVIIARRPSRPTPQVSRTNPVITCAATRCRPR
jgi:hypothetical protein